MNAFDGPVTPEGIALAVRWENGEVVEANPATKPDAATLVLPGLVCGHLETGLAFLPGMRGKSASGIPAKNPDPGSGPNSGFSRKLLDAHDEASLLASSRWTALECARNGITLVFDFWRGRMIDGVLDILSRGFADVGVRFVGSVAVDDERDPAAAMRENLRFAEKGGRVQMGIENVTTLLPELVTKTRRAELSAHLLLPTSWRGLAEKGALRPDSIAVLHEAHDLDEEEQAILRDLAIWTVVPPHREVPALLHGRTLAGGTTAILPAPFTQLARGWDAASAILDAPFGRLAPGAPADFVLCDPPLPAPLTPTALPAHLERLSATHIREVVCAGETILRDHRATRVDESEIRAHAREQLTLLWKRAA